MQDYSLATAGNAIEKCVDARRTDVTLRQNIDAAIARYEAQIKELQETKARLESTGILDARIDDIQRSMRY